MHSGIGLIGQPCASIMVIQAKSHVHSFRDVSSLTFILYNRLRFLSRGSTKNPKKVVFEPENYVATWVLAAFSALSLASAYDIPDAYSSQMCGKMAS